MRRLAALVVILAACGGNDSRPVGQTTWPSLTLSSPQAGGEFGRAVAFLGDLVAVGAPDQNRVYVYEASRGALVRTLRGTGRFGAALAANGNELFVGAPQDGRVDVYDAVRGERLQTLQSGTGGSFGAAIAVSGAEVWVGAPARHSGAGEVVRFAWPSGVKIGAVASPHAVPGGAFGAALAENAGLFAVGAPGEGRVYHLRSGVIVDVLKGADGFGTSVALGGGLTLVGSPVEGRAFVYGAGGAPLALDAGLPRFGLAVALDGTHAVVAGAAGTGGRTLVFDAFTGTLQQDVALGAAPGGATLAAKDGIALVGLFQLAGGGAGLAGTFNCGTGDVIAQYLPPAAAAGGTFGRAVAMLADQGLVAVSQPQDGVGTDVYLMDFGGNLVRTLTRQTGWGEALAVRGSNLVIGAPQEDVGQTSNAGAVHIVDVTNGNILLSIPNPEPEAGGGFGGAIAVVGNNLLVGAEGNGGGEGRAYLVNGATGAVIHTFSSPQSTSTFGAAVAADGDDLYVGEPLDTSGEAQRGLVHQFDRVTGNLIRTLESPDPDDDVNRFGEALAAFNGEVWVGAPGADIVPLQQQQGFFDGAGRVYVFARDGKILKSLQSVVPQDNGEFGFSLSAGAPRVAIGAPGETLAQLQGFNPEGVVHLYDAPVKFLIRRFRSLNPESFGRYGESVFVPEGGAIVLAGAPGETVQNLSNAGRAYLHEAFLFQAHASPRAQDNGNFGEAVAVGFPGLVVIGAPREGNNDGAAYVIDTFGGNVTPLDDPAGPGAASLMGRSVAVLGTTVLVGATNAVHLFDISGSFLGTIQAPNAGDFGAVLAPFDGNTFLVAAPNDGNGTVYRMDLSGNVIQSYVSDAAGIAFGTSVAEVGGRVCVGAPSEAGTGGLSGSVHVFNATTGARLRKIFSLDAALTGQFGLALAEFQGALLASVPQGVSVETVWLIDVETGAELLELTHPDGTVSGFGRALAATTDVIVVGAFGSAGNTGEVFVFDDLGNLVERFFSPNAKNGGLFGLTLATNDFGNLLIGAPGEDVNPTSAGRGYSFFVDGGGNGGDVALESPNPEQDGQFGKALAFAGAKLSVGAPGENGERGRVYVISGEEGSEGTLVQTLNSPNAVAGGEFGATLAANASFLAVGAPGENSAGVPVAGRAYLFDPCTGQLLLSFQSTNPLNEGEFGGAVAIAAANVAVGASGETVRGLASAGRVYYFDCVIDTPLVVLLSPNPVAGGDFGYAVATVGTTVYVGAPGENNNAGRVYCFNGLTGQLLRTIPAPSGGRFGERLFLLNTSELLVGAPAATSGQVANAGRAYRINVNTGAVVATFDSGTPTPGGGFGLALAANLEVIAIGAPFESNGAGNIHTFFLSDNSFEETTGSDNPEPGGEFGFSIVGFGFTGAVGAPFETAADVPGAGRVYVGNEDTAE